MEYRRKIVSHKSAQLMKEQGYKALDPHCHSSYSYDVPDVPKTSPFSVVREQKRQGLMPLLSDHDTMKGYLKVKGKAIPSVEMTIKPLKARLIEYNNMHTLHVNIFGLNLKQFDILEEIAGRGDLDEFVCFLRQEDLAYMYNHPFWHDTAEKIEWRAVPGLAKNYFDVLELNAGFPGGINDLTLRMAQKLGKGVVSSTDSHTGRPGHAFVLAEGKNFQEFWQNIKEARMHIVRNDMNAINAVRESSDIISHIFKSNINAPKDRRYRGVFGFAPIDIIAKSVANGSLRDKSLIKKSLQILLQGINYSAGPIIAWRLYVNKKNAFADSVRSRIDRMILDMHHRKAKKSYINRAPI